MTFTCLGVVEKVLNDSVLVRDALNGEQYPIHLKGDALLTIKEQSDAVFIGDYIAGKFRANKVEISKFLNSLYEQDLFERSGAFTLVAVIDDPFPEIYKKLLSEVKEVVE